MAASRKTVEHPCWVKFDHMEAGFAVWTNQVSPCGPSGRAGRALALVGGGSAAAGGCLVGVETVAVRCFVGRF